MKQMSTQNYKSKKVRQKPKDLTQDIKYNDDNLVQNNNKIVTKTAKREIKDLPQDNENNNNDCENHDELSQNITFLQLETDEWTPDINDNNWDIVKSSSPKYFIYRNIPNIEITVTEELINEAKQFYLQMKKDNAKSIYDKNDNDMNNIKKEKIYKFIKIYDERTIPIISYTTNNLFNSVKSNLVAHFMNPKKNRLNDFQKIEGIKFCLIGCYKGNIPTKELNNIKNNFLNKVGKNTIFNDPKEMINYYQTTMNKMINSDNLDDINKKTYYIYRVYRQTDNTKQFIFGSYDFFIGNKKDVDDIILKYSLFFDKGIIIMKNIHSFECQLECEGLLKTDEYIYKYDTIKSGLNLCYNLIIDDDNYKNIDFIKKEVFLQIQRSIMIGKYDNDNNDYEKMKCYIAFIENKKNDKFVFSSQMPLKQKLDYFYSFGESYPKKYHNIMNILYNSKFVDLTIKILETNVDEKSIKTKLNTYINKINICKNGNDLKSQYNLLDDSITKKVNKIIMSNIFRIRKNLK